MKSAIKFMKARLFVRLMLLAFVPQIMLAQATFTRITNGAIATDLGYFTRPVWCDFNKDGWLDLFVSGITLNVFYLNNGDGTFTKRTAGNPVQDTNNHIGSAGGDYDNDGSPDLVVAGGALASSPHLNTQFHNNGDGTFTLVTGSSITTTAGYFDACAWVDYDKDGFLDLVITDSGGGGPGKTFLFHNLGNGTFRPVTSLPLTTDPSTGIGVLWADYDGDGWMDLLVINVAQAGSNFLYHNNNGTFARITNNAIATDMWPSGAGGGAWGDYDNDGLPDLLVTDFGASRNRLYHNEGHGVFANVTPGSGFPMLLAGSPIFGCAWGDYDNDGYLDLFMANHDGPNALFHNNGDGTFSQILSEAAVTESNCLSVAWADYDNDGSLDLFLTRALFNGGSISNLLYHNNGSTNFWLEIKLVGTVANRSGIGAKVRVRATIGGKTFWQLREINNGGGFNIQPLVAHFGLGDATNVETLRIEWPSGTVQEIQNVAAKQIMTVTEPPRLLSASTNGIVQFTLRGGRNLQYDLQTSTNLADWSLLSTLTITNLNGTAPIMDTNAPGSDRRFYRAVLK